MLGRWLFRFITGVIDMPIDNHAVGYSAFYWGLKWLGTAYKVPNPQSVVARRNAYKRFIEAGLRPDFAYEFSEM